MEEAEAWGRTQVGELYAAGRGFTEREHVHTCQYLPDSTVAAQEDGVPLELALDHNYRGLVAVMIEPADGFGRTTAIETINGVPVKALLYRCCRPGEQLADEALARRSQRADEDG